MPAEHAPHIVPSIPARQPPGYQPATPVAACPEPAAACRRLPRGGNANMPLKSTLFCVILIFKCVLVPEAFLVVPEDVGTAFAAIYGFSPRIVLGRDHRLGWGFRLGSHADLQLLYELGLQTTTRGLHTTAKVRSAPAVARFRRRPVLELLLRAGLLLAPAVRQPPLATGSPRQPAASPQPPAPRERREMNAQLV